MTRDDLPIYVWEYVLGVRIGVRQRYNGPTDVEPSGLDYFRRVERRYIAEWSRRVLFRVEEVGQA